MENEPTERDFEKFKDKQQDRMKRVERHRRHRHRRRGHGRTS